MAQFIIDSTDPATEQLVATYRDRRGGVQAVAGQMYQAIARSEAAYAALETELAAGGALESIADYHTALQAPVADAVTTLRSSMTGVMALMEQMQAAMPVGVELFPGVPRAEE